MSTTSLLTSNPLNKERGYTLIEILVVMTIITILFLAGIAAYREFSRRQELASIVRQVKSDIRLAQELAIASKKPVNCPVLDGYYFVIISSSRYEIRSNCDIGERIEKSVDMPSGLTISGLSPDLDPSNYIRFKSLGQGTNIPEGTSTSITITQTGFGKTSVITVTASGEIQ